MNSVDYCLFQFFICIYERNKQYFYSFFVKLFKKIELKLNIYYILYPRRFVEIYSILILYIISNHKYGEDFQH